MLILLKHRDFALHDFLKNCDFIIVILRQYQKQNQDDKKIQRLKKRIASECFKMSKISSASIDLAIRTKRNCWTPIKTNRCIDLEICILLSPWLEKLGEQNQDFYNSPSHGAWKNLDFAIVILPFPGRV